MESTCFFLGYFKFFGPPFFHLEQFEEILHAKSSIWFEMRNGVNKFLFRGFPVDWATLFPIWAGLRNFTCKIFNMGCNGKWRDQISFHGDSSQLAYPIS